MLQLIIREYQNCEWRISIYGRSKDEWDKLAKWIVDHKLHSHNVRWLIQVPRLYDVYRRSGLVPNFEQIIRSMYSCSVGFPDEQHSLVLSVDIFEPLFEVTKDPSSHPELHVFLQRVIGFDSVDDESKSERRIYKKFPYPKVWDTPQNPPYSYWFVSDLSSHPFPGSYNRCRIYFMYANMTSLNGWRRTRGFSE